MTTGPTTGRSTGPVPADSAPQTPQPRVPTPRQPIVVLPGAAHGNVRPGRRALYSALRPFVLSSLIAFIAVAAATVVWGGRLATTEALGQAEATGRGVAEGIVAPLVTRELRAGDPAALTRLDASMRNRMSDGSIFRVKIWTADQRILYSDRADLIGRHYPLEHADLALLGTTNASAAISDLQHSENVDERGTHGQAVEVYAGFAGADGSPLIFEAYLPAGAVYQDAYRLERALLPLSLGSVTLLLALLMPLAVSMARRIEHTQGERNRLLHASISSSDNERRRIARDLHDTVVQDLVGLSYSLSAVAQNRSVPQDDAVARDAARSAAVVVRRDVAALRTLIGDIYPPELRAGQLPSAVAALLETTVGQDVRTHLESPPVMNLPVDTAVLVYRVVREALRNTAAHAEAHVIGVELAQRDGAVTAVVVDDGVGMRAQAQHGHLGLRLLADTVRDAGGTFELTSCLGGGVRVSACVPVNC